MSPGSSRFSDAEVARVTLRLDDAVTQRRRASAAGLSTYRGVAPNRPIKPTRTELAVLSALAHVYGSSLANERFIPVIECVADCGAVEMVKRALWGEGLDDARISALLLDARTALDILVGTWPTVFMAEAHAQLEGFRPRPPTPPDSGEDDGRK
ncbi:hypothetical protein B0G84_7965 [Paraburkholderia sp. BL8N3]|nr:hypothetical protein B0G84_7965 [Paraburkholderia sp. BL8N3]